MSHIIRLGVVCVLILFVASVARADILLSAPVVAPSGSDFTWTYTATLTDGFEINPPPASCPSPPAPGGSSCDGLLVIYDFGSYVSGTEFAPAGWTFVGAFTGPTPIGITPGSIVASVDDPLVINLAWAYTGGVQLIASGSNLGLGSFGADSSAFLGTFSEYNGRTNQTSPFGRAINAAITTVPQVPEPMTFLLMGSGLLALGILRRHQKNRR